jgi:(R,R)-butanediol dehydrogenase/meso-butanediol dehydrogenase/diacetyl reductase
MKAAVFKRVGRPLAIERLDDPVPGPGELLLKVGRCGICGTDLHMTDGHAQTYPENTVIGHEFAGEVVALGKDVSGYKLGDVVAAMPVVGCGQCGSCRSGEPMWCEQGLVGISGGFGQYALAKAHAAIRLPRSLSLADGALVEPLAVGLHGVALAGLAPGARVLVQGAGAIGLAAAFWARRLGAGRIAMTARSTRGEPFAGNMGVDHFLLAGEDLQVRVNAALGGAPEVVFECVGVPGMVAQAVNLVRPRGTVVILGNCMLPDTFYPAQAMFKQVRIQGSMVYSLREFETVAAVLDDGHVEPRSMVTGTVSYAELPQAFEALRRPGTQCKLMLDPWASN